VYGVFQLFLIPYVGTLVFNFFAKWRPFCIFIKVLAADNVPPVFVCLAIFQFKKKLIKEIALNFGSQMPFKCNMVVWEC
jgi:hypothetical protein